MQGIDLLAAPKKITDAIVWIGRNLRALLLLVGCVWVIYLGSLLVESARNDLTLQPLFKQIDGMGLLTNVLIPAICIGTAGFSIYWRRKQIWDKVWWVLRRPVGTGIDIEPELVNENCQVSLLVYTLSKNADCKCA